VIERPQSAPSARPRRSPRESPPSRRPRLRRRPRYSPWSSSASSPRPVTRGYFYTLSSTEAASAARQYKFTPIAHNLGYLSGKPFKNSITIYRLRYKPFSSYPVTASTSERDKPPRIRP
jgi:hypothetical protein